MAKLNDRHRKFLDKLRDSGATNMFAAPSYLREAFDDLSKAESRAVVTEWMAEKEGEVTNTLHDAIEFVREVLDVKRVNGENMANVPVWVLELLSDHADDE